MNCNIFCVTKPAWPYIKLHAWHNIRNLNWISKSDTTALLWAGFDKLPSLNKKVLLAANAMYSWTLSTQYICTCVWSETETDQLTYTHVHVQALFVFPSPDLMDNVCVLII